MHISKNTFLTLALTLILVPMAHVSAAEFDPNYLISDTEITNYRSMSQSDIQRFLDRREGTLKSYVAIDKEGRPLTAAETFYQTALNARINPKYLLVLVQKEMSLLDDNTPKQSQYDWATGYGCPDGGGCNSRWQGFFKQVNSAALQTRDYVDNPTDYYYQPGVTRTIDGKSVTPKNAATAGLYSYTPHVDCQGTCGGNKLFWNLWNKYFGKKWPDGALLQTENSDTVYHIENGAKRAILSKSIFFSRFDDEKVVTVAEDDLSYYDDGPAIQYHNFSLLRNPYNEIYMIVDDTKRKIDNMDVFNKIGFMEDEIIDVSNSIINSYKNGPKISKYTIYPTGKLLEDESLGDIYYVISGKKKLVTNQEIISFNFQGLQVEKTSATQLNKYRTGNPVTIPDGELVKTSGANTVYVISNGQRLPIFNGGIFLSMNYDWDNVISVGQDTLDVHPLGQTITGDW
jgi:hypothetical protein